MRGVLRMLGVIIAVTLVSSAAYAVSAPLVVDSAWLDRNSGKVVIVDVRDKDAYREGHIQNAINMPVNSLQSKPDAILLPSRELEKILGGKGLDISKEVVLYGAGKEIASLEFWMLDYLGMQKVHVLDGGIEQWKGRLSTVETKLPPAVFRANPDPGKYAATDYVGGALKKTGVVILDVRTPGEYKGTDVRSLRGGHIPGAINMNFEGNYLEGSTRLKSTDELAKLYSGLDKNKEIIVYCQTGTRATNTYLVLKELGFPRVRNYDASWVEWGSNLSLPADDVSYFNFMSLIGAVKKLEKGAQKQ